MLYEVITGFWKQLPALLSLSAYELRKISDDEVVITSLLTYEKVKLNLTYTITGDGSVKVDYALDADAQLPRLLRVGMSTQVPFNLENMSYYGKGPWENYSDRAAAAEVNVYRGKVTDFVFEYAQPQECSNRTDVRWLQLTKTNGDGLKIVGAPVLSTSVWPWTATSLEAARHTNELRTEDFFTVIV